MTEIPTEVAPVTPPPPRVRKTAASKAQEALDVAERKLVSLNARLVKAKADVELLTAQITAETIERDYFKGHPALAGKTVEETIGADGIRVDPPVDPTTATF